MILKKLAGLLGLVVLGTVACNEVTPTGVDPNVLPDEPVTVEVRVPWEQFASNLSTYGGFGTPDALGLGIVAHQFGDSLESRTVAKFNPIPTTAVVRDTTGTSLTDTLLHVMGGRIIAVVDTLGNVTDGPVSLEAGILEQQFDVPTATWDRAVDSVAGTQTPWQEPGAGPVTHVMSTVWDPASGDSAVFELDSAGVATWSDTASVRGIRINALTSGARLKITNILFQVDVTPSSNPDTTVVVVANRTGLSFVYTPQAPDPDGSIRVGGAPAWRSVMDVSLPATLDGNPTLCAATQCPLALTAGRVSYAALVLTSEQVGLSFRPADSVNVDVRPVFDPTALPKAPLGPSLLTASIGKRLSPTLFGQDVGSEVEIPITSFVRTLLEPDTSAALPPPSTLALLSTYEPVSFSYADFFGPGSLQPPVLKLIVTVGRPVELP